MRSTIASSSPGRRSRASSCAPSKLDAIDLANLVEEVESLGWSDRRGTDSQLVRLQAHLLKWQIQPEKRSSSWRGSIADARNEIALFFEQSPSLRRHAPRSMAGGLRPGQAPCRSADEAALSAIPDEPPFTRPEILDDDFWPPIEPMLHAHAFVPARAVGKRAFANSVVLGFEDRRRRRGAIATLGGSICSWTSRRRRRSAMAMPMSSPMAASSRSSPRPSH